MNKFTMSITNGNEALATRGALVGNAAKLAQEDLVRTLESEINDKKLRMMQLCDISPENTQDTKPRGLAAENPKEWVKQIHALKVDLALQEAELEIAKETLTEWFTDASTGTAS